MNKALRRSLTFLGMVAAGLLVIALLTEEGLRTPSSAAREGSSEIGGVVVRDESRNSSQEVILGEIEFGVMEERVLEDGSVVEVPVYRIHIMGGQPGADGRFVVDLPTITFLDESTGEPAGSLRAETGAFDSDEPIGANFILDQSQLDVRSLTLERSVIGELPLDDGGVATLSAERLDIDGDDVHGPGRVTWLQDDLELSGLDMHWSGAARLLTYEADAQLIAQAKTGVRSTLRAPGGLSWELPEGKSGRGRLYGPVSGEDNFGNTLNCDELRADIDAGSLELLGNALLRQQGEAGDAKRFGAQRLVASRDAFGALKLQRASGKVRATLYDVDGLETSFATEEIVRLDADHLNAAGDVSWRHQGVLATGRGLLYDELSGRVDMAREVHFIADQSAPETWRGADLQSPAGMLWDGEVFVLRGPVVGGFGESHELRADVLAGAMKLGELHLSGSARFDQLQSDGSLQELEAFQIDAWRDEAGAWSRVHARGDVRGRSSQAGHDDLFLQTEALERHGSLVSMPGAFELRSGELTRSGVGLLYDETVGFFDIARDAKWSSATTEGLGPFEFVAEGGVAWWLETDPSGATSGFGDLRGPVLAERADGTRLEAAWAYVSSAKQRLTLHGDAQLTQTDGSSLRSDEIDLEQTESGVIVRSPTAFEFDREELGATGIGLRWHQLTGELEILREGRLSRELPEGGLAFLEAGDELCWTPAADSDDPMLGGSGRLLGGVRGSHPVLGELSTEELHADGARGLFVLLGKTRVEQNGTGWLTAGDSLVLQRDPATQRADVSAGGGVEGEWLQLGSISRFGADQLVRRESAARAELIGHVKLERLADELPMSLHTGPLGRVTLIENAAGELTHAHAIERVTITRGELVAEADRLHWDVAEDHLELRGNCRFLAMGAWMNMERVDIWPGQMRWFVPRADIELTPREGAENNGSADGS